MAGVPNTTNKNKKKGERSTAENPPRITVVGIGASAGGIEALQAFFDAVPADVGLAYVVVVHLAPDHESELVADPRRGARRWTSWKLATRSSSN